MSATDSSEESYFRAIEETFIGLRGAPLLLSPADWQTARRWHQAGIPLDLVQRALEEVFARLAERDPERKIQSLRYCAPAVEEAWREVRDLSAAEGRMEALAIDVEARLEDLVAALPGDLDGREALAAELRALSGDAESVERRLGKIEESFLATAAERLDPSTRDRLAARLERALERARPRIAAAEIGALERRLRRDLVRRALGLPTLSLFAVEDVSGR